MDKMKLSTVLPANATSDILEESMEAVSSPIQDPDVMTMKYTMTHLKLAYVSKAPNSLEEDVLKSLPALKMPSSIVLNVSVFQATLCKTRSASQSIVPFPTVLVELSSMVFLAPAILDFSNKPSVLVLHAPQEPNGMVKNVDLNQLKPVLLDIFSTPTSNNVNHQLLLVVITLSSMEPPVSASQDIT